MRARPSRSPPRPRWTGSTSCAPASPERLAKPRMSCAPTRTSSRPSERSDRSRAPTYRSARSITAWKTGESARADLHARLLPHLAPEGRLEAAAVHRRGPPRQPRPGRQGRPLPRRPNTKRRPSAPPPGPRRTATAPCSPSSPPRPATPSAWPAKRPPSRSSPSPPRSRPTPSSSPRKRPSPSRHDPNTQENRNASGSGFPRGRLARRLDSRPPRLGGNPGPALVPPSNQAPVVVVLKRSRQPRGLPGQT